MNPVQEIWSLIGMPQPGGGRGRGGGGGFPAATGATIVNTGDYSVTMTVGGQTFKQTFRVERVNGGGDAAVDFGGEQKEP